ncbi:3-isopropylmalate dehydrogenase [hydrothermal vent metagenome]|uniref:3-isopropylmalate dehydrogenase n=1 Tax=hydrothermal vent metagenome TaxID=652676 RepID=A0A3B0TDU5_9ZZZZ
MISTPSFDIATISGDGIGPEVIDPCIGLLEQVQASVGGFKLNFIDVPAGAGLYARTGDAYPEISKAAAKAADAILLSALGLPDIRYPDGTEITPQIELRFQLGLYAGVRPVRPIPGLKGHLPLADPRAMDIDMVLVRESTEGLFASYGKGTVEDDRIARDTMVITRNTCERLFDFSFALAASRGKGGGGGNVVCVDKANVFQSLAFFRKIFDERAENFPSIDTDHCYVDAMALNMVRHPWAYDVAVTENMFGDILSDLGAGLVGGMGMAPSADIGDNHGVFQPCHGSAPDIAGKGVANPTAMFLSAGMMLDWLGTRHDNAACRSGGALLRAAVDKAFEAGDLIPGELGGSARTDDVTGSVLDALKDLAPANKLSQAQT